MKDETATETRWINESDESIAYEMLSGVSFCDQQLWTVRYTNGTRTKILALFVSTEAAEKVWSFSQ